MEFTSGINVRSAQIKTDRSNVRQMPLSILIVGRDQEMLHLVERAIRSQSDLSIRPVSPEEAEPLSQHTEPHLWLFCNTFEIRTLVYLACRVNRYSPQSRLLLLAAGHRVGFEGTLFHRVISCADDETLLFEAVSQLCIAA